MQLLFAFLYAACMTASPTHPTDLRDQLARKWLMIEMTMNGKKYDEKWLERQRQNGLASVLEFHKNGACQVHIHTKGIGGRTQKKTTNNKWQLSEDGKQLTIKTEGEPSQVFDVVKISSKKLILSVGAEKEKQVFTYKSIKD